MRQVTPTEHTLDTFQRHYIRVAIGVLNEEFAQPRLILGEKKLDSWLVQLLRAECLPYDLHSRMEGPELRLYVQEEGLLFCRLGVEKRQGEA